MRAAVLLALGLLVPPGLRVAEAQECDASEPDFTGNNMVGALDSCDGTAADAACGHTCASGYEGGSVTCESSGDYTVTACTSIVCTRPSDVTGYTVADTNLDLGAGAFDVTAACAAGYEGTAAASACSTHGRDYTLSGCSGCAPRGPHEQPGQLQCTNGVLYQLWDNDADTTNDLAGINSIEALRCRCRSLGLTAVRLQSAAQVHDVLRPLVQQAGYDLTVARGAGVPLGYDYAGTNSFQALDSPSVAVSPIMQDLHNSYGYTGNHLDSSDLARVVAGFGWGVDTNNVGISDWLGFGVGPLQALICSDNALESSQPRECDFESVALLKFRADGDPGDELSSWVGSPCAAGWDRLTTGWRGVTCSSWGARVAHIDLHGTAVAGSIESLAPLTGLQEIHLHGTRVTGAIDSLASMTSLQKLSLHNTGVVGRPSALAPCQLLTSLKLYATHTETFIGVLATRGTTLTELYPNCPPGQYSVVNQDGSAVCNDCAAGKFSPTVGTPSVGGCLDCTAGKHAASGSGSCIDCAAGKYLAFEGSSTSSDCIDCAAGKYVGATETCSALGSSFVGWAGACVPRCVMLGAAWNDNIADCQECAPGRSGTATGSSSCIDCVAGKYVRARGSTSCIDCPLGTYLPTDGNNHPHDCIDCPGGKYLDVTGAGPPSDCIDCVVGKFVEAFGNIAASDCIDCSAGRYIDVTGSDAASDCIYCVAGTYVATSGSGAASDCIDCVPGKYKVAVGSVTPASCIDCAAGKQSTLAGSSDSANCIYCVAGKYVSMTGSTGCIDCAAGKYLPSIGNTNALACIDCIAGRYLDVTGGGPASDCIVCVVGRYVTTAGAVDCVDCEAGKYSDTVENSIGCIDCAPGKYVVATTSDEASDCIECVAGKYLNAVGSDESSDCIDCPEGKYSGTAAASDQFDCIECAAGKYLDATGQTDVSNCKDCVAGRYTYASGRTSCIKCPFGTYSSSVGSALLSECIACMMGRYNDGEGLSGIDAECYDCTGNSNTASVGAGSVADCVCDAGYSGVLARVSSTCNACPADTFKANQGLPIGRTFNSLNDFNTIREYRAPGQYTYTVPNGVTKLLVYVWGAGGGGGAAHLEEATGGGGGGFSMQQMAVLAGQEFAVVVGAGGEASGECVECTGTATDGTSTCDLDAATDGTADCPAGCTVGLPLHGTGTAGGDSSFGTIVATGGHPGRDLGGPSGAGGLGDTANGIAGGRGGGGAGGGEYGGGAGGREVEHGTLGAGGRWPGGGSSGRSYCALSPETLDQTLVAGGDGAVIVVAGPTTALAVTGCAACLPNSFTEALTGVQSQGGCSCGAGYQGQLADADAMCTPCPQDTYKTATGTADCTQCAAHATTVGATGSVSSTSCICSRGYTGDGSVCEACPVDMYKATRGEGSCVPCPADSTTNGNAAAPRIAACVCDLGYEARVTAGGGRTPSLQSPSSVCDVCPVDTYKDVQEAQLCTDCTAHSSTQGITGSTAVDACLCDTGFEGDLNSSYAVCTPCAYGKYKSSVGTDLCVDCPANSDTLRPGAQSVDECMCNMGWSGALTLPESECTVCAADKYKSTVGPDGCLQCPVGAGTQTVTGSISVYNCSCQVGNEIHEEQTRTQTITSCRVCQPNFYKDNAGPNLCLQCTPHSTTLDDNGALVNGSTTVTACKCDPGYVGDIVDAGTSCQECAVDTYKENSGTAACDACLDARPYTNTNGLTGRALVSDCVCQIGYGWFDTDATDGTDGDVDANGAPLCQACPADTYKDVSATEVCKSCTADSITNGLTAQTIVSACLCLPARRGMDGAAFTGVLADASYTCEPCPADTYKEVLGIADCDSCTAHSTTNQLIGRELVSSCLCDPGYHSNVVSCTGTATDGTSICDLDAATDGTADCPAGCSRDYIGGHLQVGSICRPCMQDHYKSDIGPGGDPTGAWPHPTPCVSCTAESGTDSGAKTRVDDCECNEGYTGLLDTPDAVCSACAVNTYKALRGPEACTLCPEHSSTWIDLSGENRAEASTATSDCKCDRGWTGDIQTQGDQCVACPADTYKEQTGHTGERGCDQCTDYAGTVGITATAVVSGCMCDPGYQGTLDTTTRTCDACMVDKYKADSGVAPCIDCPGAYNTNGTTAAVACFCDPGFEFRDDDCYECPAGRFKEDNGLHLCDSCPAHSTTYDPAYTSGMDGQGYPALLTARTSAQDCLCDTGYRGSVTSVNSECEACEISTYKSKIGDFPCVQCTNNAVTIDVGQSLVGDCKCNPGYVCADNCYQGNIAAASATCAKCPVHKYKSYVGGFGFAQCTSCPHNSGTWTEEDGSMARTAATAVSDCVCKPGWYGRLMFPSDTCSECRTNSYKTDHSIYNCFQCPTSSYTFGVKGSAFAGDCECDVGWVGTIVNRYSSCAKCPVGSYKGSRGEQLCTICPANMVTDPKNISVSIKSCFCAVGYVARPNALGESECIRCEFDMEDNTGCEAFPPRASIEDHVYPLKVSPSKRVALMGGYQTRDINNRLWDQDNPDPREQITFSWRAWEEMPDNSSVPLDITDPDMLASSLTGLNLVIRELALEEGSSYRFRIIVTSKTPDYTASADYDSIFTMNIRPYNGSLAVEPPVGVAIETRFVLSAMYWIDEDLPFTYKFGFELRDRRKWLTPSIGNSSTRAMLPPGSGGVNISTANFTNITSTDGSSDMYPLLVIVTDAFGAAGENRTNVTVMPYVKVEGVSWAEDMLAQTNVSGSDIDPTQAYTAAAETLNSLDTSEEEVADEEIDPSAACKSKLSCIELNELYGGWPTESGVSDIVCAESDAGLGVRAFAPAVHVPDESATDGYNLVWRNPQPMEGLRERLNSLDTEAGFYTGCSFTGTAGATGVHYNRWNNVGGGTRVSDLLEHNRYKNNPPDETNILLDFFEAPVNVCDRCGTRMDGYFRAAEDGLHTFRVSADDRASVWFGDSVESAMAASPICSVPGWTASRQWNKYSEQTAAPIELTAGSFYYVRAVAKEGGGGDNLAVGVTTPSGVTLNPIPVATDDGTVYMFRDARMKVTVEGVDHDVEFAQLKDCLVTHRAVCAKLCDDVDGCVGYELHATNAAKCVLFDSLTGCASNDECGDNGRDWQPAECDEYDDGGSCTSWIRGHYLQPDQCHEEEYCAASTADTHKLIGLADPSPSLIPPESVPTSECVRAATWGAAVTACINIGARLCTQAELQNNEAANTGCFESEDLIWSNEFVQCTAGQHMAVSGYSGGAASVDPTCMDDSATAGIRCCADVDTDGHLCIDPSAPTAMGLSGDLGNARGEMINGMAGGTESGGGEDEAAMASGAIESLTGSPDQLDDTAQDASLGALDSMVNPPPPDQCYEVRCGKGANQNDKCLPEEAYCAPSLELHEVRCCSDTKLDGWTKKNGCDVWGETDPPELVAPGNGVRRRLAKVDCQHALNHADASSFCMSVGGRLCTAEELESGCTRGTGCAHDRDLVWSSTTPPPPEPEPEEQATANECAAVQGESRRLRRLGATEVEVRRRMSESDCQQPASLNQDGAQSSANGAANVMNATALAAQQAALLEEQARIEEERLQRIADCREDCEADYPPVEARRCLSYSAGGGGGARRLEGARSDTTVPNASAVPPVAGARRRMPADEPQDEGNCAEWECFEHGNEVCTEYWTDDMYCDVRCRVGHYNGGSPDWSYDPYEDVTQPCSPTCGTWEDCCVTEGVRCVQQGGSSDGGGSSRRLQETRSIDWWSLLTTNAAEATQPCSRAHGTWEDCCVAEGVWCVQHGGSADEGVSFGAHRRLEATGGAWARLAEVASSLMGWPLAPARTEVQSTTRSPLLRMRREHEDAVRVQRQVQPGELDAYGYLYGPTRPHAREPDAGPECATEMAACAADSDCAVLLRRTDVALDHAPCLANERCADLRRCTEPDPGGFRRWIQADTGRRQLKGGSSTPPPPPPSNSGTEVHNKRGCLYDRSKNWIQRPHHFEWECNDPPCHTFRCKTWERECTKDTYLDASAQQQCKAECDGDGSDNGRRRMLEAHEEATGVTPPSHPKHIHLVNEMLRAVHHGHGRRALLQSQRSKDEVSAARAGAVVGVLGGVGSAVAGRLLPGEEPELMESAQYTMEIQQFTRSTLDGAAVAGGQVQVPIGQNLTGGDVSTQTISWQANPYDTVSGSQTAEDPASVLSTDVFSLRLVSGVSEVPVSGLQETFNITLRRSRAGTGTGAAALNGSNTSNISAVLAPMCSELSCINTYDVVHGSGACALALHHRGYTCEDHFCPDCELAGFCDVSCDPACNSTTAENSTDDLASIDGDEAASAANCTLDDAPSCAYWDVAAMRWRTDGTVLNITETTITCAFRHLTDFSAMFSPPAQTAELADLSDTFDLAAFALANPVGLAVSLVLFCCVVLVAGQSVRDLTWERKTKNVRHKIKTDVISKKGRSFEYGQKFALWEQEMGIALGDRVEKMLPTRLRSDYLCGSFWFGLKGEPFDKWQRLLVVLCTFLLTLMVNVFFFQSKHNQLEMCEGPLVDGRPSNCTGDVSQQSLCHCRIYDCGVQGCNNCERCDTMANCGLSCPELESNRIIQTFVTILLTWPIGSVLKSLFEWLHKPYVAMVEAELHLAREAESRAAVKRRHASGGKRRYGRVQRQAAKAGHTSSDLVGDEGSQLWTESDTGQEEVRMEEEAAEVHKEDWEKHPILPDGKLPCEECGDIPMYPPAIIMKMDYFHLESRLSQETREPSYEKIMELFDEKELCCILHHHDMPYSYSHKKGVQNLQQSKPVMAWQVHRMIDSKITRSGTNLAQHTHKRRNRRATSMRDLQSRVFTKKEGTNWEHAVEELKLSNPGRSVANHRRRRGRRKGQDLCPKCKGTGTSGKVWFVTERKIKDGNMRNDYIQVTPQQRRMAMKASEKKKQVEKKKQRTADKKKGQEQRKTENTKHQLPQLDDVADRREKTCGQWDWIVPYAVGLFVAMVCVVQIARTVRNFSGPRTVEWLASSVVSLVLSWTLTDPLKVILLTPFKAFRKHRGVESRARHLSKAHAKLQTFALLRGGASSAGAGASNGGLDRFRRSGHSMDQIAAVLDAKQRIMIKAAVRKQEREHRQNLAARHEQERKDLENGKRPALGRGGGSVDDLRLDLKKKQQEERQRLDEQMKVMDDDMHNVINGQHDKFQSSVATVNPSQSHSQSLMANYNSEAARLQEEMTAKKRKEQDALQAKIAEKRRQMAERVASVEKLLHIHSRAVDESVSEKAVREKARQDEVAAMKAKLSDATAKMERVLWTNRHVTSKAAAAFSGTSSATSTAADAFLKKRSLASDIKARKTGLYVGDEDNAESNPEAVHLAIESAIAVEEEPDPTAESRMDAARRWRNLSAWQARVTALASLPADGPVDVAQVAKAAAANRSGAATEAAERLRAGRGTGRETVVTFSPARDEVTIPPRRPPVPTPRVLPRPPPAATQSPAAAARPVPPQRAPAKAGGTPKSAERKAKEEAALRASIAVARAKLAAKKRREARKKLAMWEQEPSP